MPEPSAPVVGKRSREASPSASGGKRSREASPAASGGSSGGSGGSHKRSASGRSAAQKQSQKAASALGGIATYAMFKQRQTPEGRKTMHELASKATALADTKAVIAAAVSNGIDLDDFLVLLGEQLGLSLVAEDARDDDGDDVKGEAAVVEEDEEDTAASQGSVAQVCFVLMSCCLLGFMERASTSSPSILLCV